MIFLRIKRIKRRWRENISTWNDYQIHKSIIERMFKLLSEVSNEYINFRWVWFLKILTSIKNISYFKNCWLSINFNWIFKNFYKLPSIHFKRDHIATVAYRPVSKVIFSLKSSMTFLIMRRPNFLLMYNILYCFNKFLNFYF